MSGENTLTGRTDRGNLYPTLDTAPLGRGLIRTGRWPGDAGCAVFLMAARLPNVTGPASFLFGELAMSKPNYARYAGHLESLLTFAHIEMGFGHVENVRQTLANAMRIKTEFEAEEKAAQKESETAAAYPFSGGD